MVKEKKKRKKEKKKDRKENQTDREDKIEKTMRIKIRTKTKLFMQPKSKMIKLKFKNLKPF